MRAPRRYAQYSTCASYDVPRSSPVISHVSHFLTRIPHVRTKHGRLHISDRTCVWSALKSDKIGRRNLVVAEFAVGLSLFTAPDTTRDGRDGYADGNRVTLKGPWTKMITVRANMWITSSCNQERALPLAAKLLMSTVTLVASGRTETKTTQRRRSQASRFQMTENNTAVQWFLIATPQKKLKTIHKILRKPCDAWEARCRLEPHHIP